MNKLTQFSLLFLALMVVFAGCDAAKDKAKGMADKAKDMANVDFGDFDRKALQEKFTGIKDGFKDVNKENVDGLESKITDLSGSVDSMGIDKLPAAAKPVVSGMITKFGDAIKTAMAGISDEGILGKLKPAVETLMEKLNAFK